MDKTYKSYVDLNDNGDPPVCLAGVVLDELMSQPKPKKTMKSRVNSLYLSIKYGVLDALDVWRLTPIFTCIMFLVEIAVCSFMLITYGLTAVSLTIFLIIMNVVYYQHYTHKLEDDIHEKYDY